MRWRRWAPIVAMAGAGCVVGGLGRLAEAPERGLTAELRLADDGRIQGELLTAGEDGVLLLRTSLVTFVPWTMIRRAEIPGSKDIVENVERLRPTRYQLNRYRLFARYPLGLEEAQRARLLEAIGSGAIDTIGGGGTNGGDAPGAPAGAAAAAATGAAAGALAEAFLAEAARAAAPFADVDQARRAGYRPLGPDFPGMGQHWIRPSLVVAGVLDAAAPPVLCYVVVDGEPRLAGLAYTLPLGRDERPPTEPFGRHVWHDHAGSVDEESLMLGHPHSDRADPSGSRLAMIHVWTELANPDGILAQHNWSLPFLTRQIEPPERVDVQAARALSLAGPGRRYYRELFGAAARLAPEEADRVGAAVDRQADRAEAWAERYRGGPADEGVAELRSIWGALWGELEGSVGGEAWVALAGLRGEVGGEGH